MKSCLLITPNFYSFPNYLKKTLESLNYNVTVINDEYPNNILGRIMGKLQLPISLIITERYIYKKFIAGHKYDIILIIKGRGISKSLLNKFKYASPKIIGYNFDSFKYHSAPLKWFRYSTKYYTFDYKDSEQYSIPIIELFSSLPESQSIKKEYDISAIVRNHSKRLEYIESVVSALNSNSKYIYIYEKDIFTFVSNFLNSPLLYLKYWNHISFKPLPYLKYIEVLQKSNFTIDYAHPKQTGITIRCFEALSCQTKIITNNIFVTRNTHFNSYNSIIFNEINNLEILNQKFNELKDRIPEKFSRSINDFINEIIL